MQTFSTINSKDYTVEELYLSAPITWELVSGSVGCVVVDPEGLENSVEIFRASNSPNVLYDNIITKIEKNTKEYEYLVYRSIKHMFYATSSAEDYSMMGYPPTFFYSGSTLLTSSLTNLADESYIVSVGQQFYGDRISPGSFQLFTELSDKYIFDDEYGNLYVDQTGIITYIGNIFYDQGIAVIKHDTGSLTTQIGPAGLKLTSGSHIYLEYRSDLKVHRHEIAVKIAPYEFNFSLFNPSIQRTYQASGSVSASATNLYLQQQGIPTSGSSTDTYNLYNLMSSNILKPYVTSIGLYNDRYELLAVAKLSQPIQRTFNTDQIFIVRFDTE